MITLINRQRTISVDTEWVSTLIKELLAIVDYSAFDIGIFLTTNKTIQHYNKTYRNKKGPTDILSFSYYPHLKPGTRIHAPTEEDKNLGDIILSLEYIKKDAEKKGTTFEHRLMILLIHGICHLLGYDHETDSDWRSMRAKETHLLKKLSPTLKR